MRQSSFAAKAAVTTHQEATWCTMLPHTDINCTMGRRVASISPPP